MAQTTSDPENVLKGQEHVLDDVTVGHHHTKQRTAALLSLLSLILLADSIYRINNVAITPKNSWDQKGDNFAPIILLLAGIFELAFSSLGLLLGMGYLLYDFEMKPLTMLLLASQLLLGTFTWVVLAIAYPAYRIDKTGDSGDDAGRQRTAAVVFGWIITAMGFHGLLQAGQFFLALQFSRLQKGVTKLGSNYFRMRLLLLCGLVWLAGLGTFMCGVLIRHRAKRNDLLRTRQYFPGVYTIRGFPIFGDFNAVRWPAITIVSGIMEMIFATLAMAAAFAGALFMAAFGFGALTWMWLITAHVIAMYGLISGVVNMLAVLTALFVTALIAVPLYYAKEAHRAHKD